jgi:hypothetical protein
MAPRYLPETLIILCLLAMEAAGQEGATTTVQLPPAIAIGVSEGPTCVPAPLRQGAVLPPQSVSAVDVSDNGRFVAVGTMACRHDHNFLLLSAKTATAVWKRILEASRTAIQGDE